MASRFDGWFSAVFALDLRSLALFRIGLGVCPSATSSPGPCLTALYSDHGAVTRSLALSGFDLGEFPFLYLPRRRAGGDRRDVRASWPHGRRADLRLPDEDGDPPALGLRALTLVRNPILVYSGLNLGVPHALLEPVPPLGARYSVDSALDPRLTGLRARLCGVGAFALTLQIAFVYWFTAAMKDSAVWKDGTAIYYAMAVHPNEPLATWVAGVEPLYRFLTFATLYLEVGGPALLFVPFLREAFRGAVVAVFIGFHAAMIFSLELGAFPYFSIACWLPFVPRAVWEWLGPNLRPGRRAHRLRPHVGVRREVGEAHPDVHLVRTRSAGEGGRRVARSPGRRVGRRGAFELIAPDPLRDGALPRPPQDRSGLGDRRTSLEPPRRVAPDTTEAVPLGVRDARSGRRARGPCPRWNVAKLPGKPRIVLPERAFRLGVELGLDQTWNMYAPPGMDYLWYVAVGHFEGGTEGDSLQEGRPVSWAMPTRALGSASALHWHDFFAGLIEPPNEGYRTGYCEYLCRTWNDPSSLVRRSRLVRLSSSWS